MGIKMSMDDWERQKMEARHCQAENVLAAGGVAHGCGFIIGLGVVLAVGAWLIWGR